MQDIKCGKFISPHLIKYNERICINNKEISDKELSDILEKISDKIDLYNKTHENKVKEFDVITIIALIYFAENNCDFVVLETGMGGMYDSTNIVSGIISVITDIGLDHIDVLGSSIKEIAIQKAGIIKQNKDAVMYRQDEVTEIIEKTCKEKNSNLHLIEENDIKNYCIYGEYQKIDYKKYKNIEINLKGKCQIYNAAEVLEVIDILKEKGYKISDEAIYDGLKTIVHKARLEVLSKEPLIIFDGGHNENAINNLKENIEMYYPENKRVYIISILKTKDYKTIVKNLCQDKNAIFFFTSGNDKNKYLSKHKLYKEAKKYLNDVNMYKEEFEDAIDISKKVYGDRTILIIGSFYVYKTAIKCL